MVDAVCLNAETGERVWHFQIVHHGLWDYDLPAAPNLIDITVDGKNNLWLKNIICNICFQENDDFTVCE